MRDKLIQLLEEARLQAIGTIGSMNNGFGAWYVDYLLQHGIVMIDAEDFGNFVKLPCKVGDTVCRIYTRRWIGEDVVCDFIITDSGIYFTDDKYRETSCDRFGETVFLTREEAEAKLKELKEGDGNA